jgi:histidyl-tRNA synthetase
MIQRIKGTHDYLDLTLFNGVKNKITAWLERHNFNQIETPILESVELFKRSLGQETDVVSKEMFIVEGDKGICLRPEATASTMRAYLEAHPEIKPWKVFSFGPMFRHERPQKGRFRQFNQLNIEIINASSIAYDAQLIALLDRLFSQELKLDNYALLINFLGTSEDRERFKVALGKFLEQHVDALCETCKVRKDKNMLRVFDCKNEGCKALYRQAPRITDYLSPESQAEWQHLQTMLHMLSISYSVDPMLVRGLDYYDKTAFEFVSSNLGAQTAFCGGGRYNRLALELGASHDVPSIGAAIGFERLLLLLEPIQEKLMLPSKAALHAIIPMGTEQHALALLLADMLRAKGLCVDTVFDGGSMKNLMKRADKMGAAYTLIIGSDEQATGTVAVKNMQTGDEVKVKQIELVEFLKK